MMLVRDVESKLRRNRNLAAIVMLCLIVMLGAALRFYDLGRESYWLDEMASVYLAQGSLKSVLAGALDQDLYGVFALLAHAWIRAFGTAEAATRSLSALAGTAAIAVMYAVGRETLGRRVGLLSAFLMAISEFQIYYSQDFRYYSLFLLMTLLTFLFHVRALRTVRFGWFVLYVLGGVLLVYTIPLGAFVLVAPNLYFLLRWNQYRRARIPWLSSQMAILLAAVPAALQTWRTITVTTGKWITSPSVYSVLRTAFSFVLPLRHQRSWVAVAASATAGLAFFLIGTLSFGARMGREQWLGHVKRLFANPRRWSGHADGLLLATCWFLCPIALPFVLSKTFSPMYVDRYTIGAAPGLYLLLAWGIVHFRKVAPELVTIGAIVLMVAPGLQYYYARDVKEQWQDVAMYVEQHGKEGDVVVFAPDQQGYQRRCFRWYYRGGLPDCGIDQQLDADDAIAEKLEACVSGHERFWLLMRGPTQRFEAFFLKASRENMRLLGGWQFTGIAVYLFEVVRP